MRAVKWILVAVALLAASVVIGVLIFIDQSESTTANQQNVLAQFYEPPSPMPQELGTVVRMEPLGVDVPGGTGYRMLYVSQRPDGERAVSGGMLFIPSTPAPAGADQSSPGPMAPSAWVMPAPPPARRIPCRTQTTG